MTLPVHYDCRRGITRRMWRWLGNNDFGDCVVAAYLHLTMVHNLAKASSWKRLLYRIGFRPPHDPFSIEMYSEYLATQGLKPGPNVGVDPASFFIWLKAKGNIKDSKYIDISGSDGESVMHQAMIDWNGCLLTMVLTQDAYNHAFDGKAWVLRAGETPMPNLAHAVALVVYGPINDGIVTWGEMKNMTRQFTKACVYGCWVFK